MSSAYPSSTAFSNVSSACAPGVADGHVPEPPYAAPGDAVRYALQSVVTATLFDLRSEVCAEATVLSKEADTKRREAESLAARAEAAERGGDDGVARMRASNLRRRVEAVEADLTKVRAAVAEKEAAATQIAEAGVHNAEGVVRRCFGDEHARALAARVERVRKAAAGLDDIQLYCLCRFLRVKGGAFADARAERFLAGEVDVPLGVVSAPGPGAPEKQPSGLSDAQRAVYENHTAGYRVSMNERFAKMKADIAQRLGDDSASVADTEASAGDALRVANAVVRSLGTTLAELLADDAATQSRSLMRHRAIIAASTIIAKARDALPPEVRLSGEDFRLFHLESVRSAMNATSASTLFDAAEANAQLGLFTDMVHAISHVGNTRVNAGGPEQDSALATRLCQPFWRKTFVDTNEPIAVAAMCLPMVDARIFTPGTPQWLEMGRAFHSFEPGSRGMRLWAEASAQKLFVRLARMWFAREAPGVAAPAFECDFVQWMTRGAGMRHLLGEDSPDEVANPFEFLYDSKCSDVPRAELVMRGAAADVFFGRIYAYANAAPGRRRLDPHAKRSATTRVHNAFEDYVCFRTQFRETMRMAYSEYVEHHTSPTEIGAEVIADKREVVRRATPRRVPAALAKKRKQGAARGGAVEEAIRKTADEDAAVDKNVREHESAERRVRATEMAADYEWSQQHELNCAIMYINAIRDPDFARDADARRELSHDAARESIRPFIDAFAASSSDEDASRMVGAVIDACSRAADHPEAVSAIIAVALDRITEVRFRARCDQHWTTFRDEPERVTVRTLGTYAREGARTQYEHWHQKWAMSALFAAVEDADGRDQHVASYAARILWQMYTSVATSTSTGGSSAVWYKFEPNNHYTRQTRGTSELYGDIALFVGKPVETLLESFTSARERTLNKISELDGDGDGVSKSRKDYLETLNEINENMIKQFSQIKSRVLSERGRSSLVTMMRTMPIISRRNFDDIMNQEPTHIAFENGVVDLGAGTHATFRPGKLEDFITKSTHIHMPAGGDVHADKSHSGVYSYTHPDVVFFLKYINQVFPDPELSAYALRDFASYLFGRNSEKLFRVWTGCGNNSKSILVKIFQKALGDYCFDLPPETLSVRKFNDPSRPTPELAQSDGCRVGMMVEPNGNMELDDGQIKRFTGGDRLFSRRLHDNGSSKAACFKVVMSCNDIPNLMCSEAGKQRVAILPFLSTWKRNAPTDPAEQLSTLTFPIDDNFEEHVPRLARAAAWVLFHKFAEYRAVGISARPEIVNKHIADYWRSVDMYMSFMEECVDTAAPPAAAVVAQTLYARFVAWFVEMNPGGKAPSFSTFKTNLTRKDRLGPFHINRGNGSRSAWQGVAILDTSSQDDGDAFEQHSGSSANYSPTPSHYTSGRASGTTPCVG